MLSYANGQYVSTDELVLPVNADLCGTVRGFRIFTACRTLGDKIFYLDAHIERLFNSAKQIYMDLPHTKEELREIVKETAAKNRGEQGQEGDMLIEILYSGGKTAANGVAPAGPADLYIIVFPLKLPPDRWYSHGMKLATFAFQRQWPEVKLLNYVGAVIAHQTAVKKFAADEALFISPDQKKTVLEGTTFNFFIVKNNALVTHPLDGNILPGITRKVTLELANKMPNLEIKEKHFSYNDLSKANEAFITSSTRNVAPVVQVDEITIGSGNPGPITQNLNKSFTVLQNNY